MSSPGKGRTALFQTLQQAFRIALLAQRPNSAPTDELIGLEKDACSRREFLSGTAQLGVLMSTGALLGCRKNMVPSKEGKQAKTDSIRIAIIGAGMAGLNCAYQLKKKGYASQVYEASSRVGGRMYTASNLVGEGLTTELGGEFIDSYHTDLKDLANEFNLPCLDVHVASETSLREAFFFDGRHYSFKQIVQALEPVAKQLSKDKRPFSRKKLHGNPQFKSFDAISIAQYFDTINLSGWLRKLLEVAYLTEFGLATEEQSAMNFLSMFDFDLAKNQIQLFGISDERYKIQGGNQRLTDALYEQVKEQVSTEHRLLAIQGDLKGPYTLTFEAGNDSSTEVICDALVLTMPFSVLRKVDIRVPLPEWKTKAIGQLGYGTNAKLMMGFRTRFWRDEGYVGYQFSDTGVQTGWDNSQLQSGQIGGYTVFLGGKPGIDLGLLTPEAQANQYLPKLEQVFPGAHGQFNQQVARMHWPSHPHTLGSYACYKVGQWMDIAGNEGLPVGNIYFAGEHCSLESQGYMNGAAETGRLAAQAIVKATFSTQRFKTARVLH